MILKRKRINPPCQNQLGIILKNFCLMKIFDEVQNGFLEALKESARELEEKGFAQAGDIADKIERRGVIHHDNRNK